MRLSATTVGLQRQRGGKQSTLLPRRLHPRAGGGDGGENVGGPALRVTVVAVGVVTAATGVVMGVRMAAAAAGPALYRADPRASTRQPWARGGGKRRRRCVADGVGVGSGQLRGGRGRMGGRLGGRKRTKETGKEGGAGRGTGGTTCRGSFSVGSRGKGGGTKHGRPPRAAKGERGRIGRRKRDTLRCSASPYGPRVPPPGHAARAPSLA